MGKWSDDGKTEGDTARRQNRELGALVRDPAERTDGVR